MRASQRVDDLADGRKDGRAGWWIGRQVVELVGVRTVSLVVRWIRRPGGGLADGWVIIFIVYTGIMSGELSQQ